VVTQTGEPEAPPARIPAAGPVSQFAAALSESSSVIDPHPAARQFVAEPPPPILETKVCPFCDGEVPKTAVTCKHCGELLDGSTKKAAEPPAPAPARDGKVFADALAKAELAAADSRVRADRAATDARAKANEVAAVAQRNEERKAAIYRQIEMQAESDYRQVLLRAADSLTAAEKAAVSDCRFYSDIYQAAERMGIDPAMAVMEMGEKVRVSNNGTNKDTMSVMKHVMELIADPPVRFKRANEKLTETFDAYAQLDALAMTPSANKVAREAALADLHNKFAASMSEMRALIRTSE
jgi:hypothetical protein